MFICVDALSGSMSRFDWVLSVASSFGNKVLLAVTSLKLHNWLEFFSVFLKWRSFLRAVTMAAQAVGSLMEEE